MNNVELNLYFRGGQTLKISTSPDQAQTIRLKWLATRATDIPEIAGNPQAPLVNISDGGTEYDMDLREVQFLSIT